MSDERDYQIFEAGFFAGREEMRNTVTFNLFPSAPEIKRLPQAWEEYKASQPVERAPQCLIWERLRASLTDEERKLCKGWTFSMENH
jgi:hypothetical protein